MPEDRTEPPFNRAGDLRPGDRVRAYGDVWRAVRTVDPWGANLKIRFTDGADAVYPAWKRLDIERG